MINWISGWASNINVLYLIIFFINILSNAPLNQEIRLTVLTPPLKKEEKNMKTEKWMQFG